MFKEGGFRTARLDLQYMSAKPDAMNPCDLLSDAGFAFQGVKPLSIFDMFFNVWECLSFWNLPR